MRHLFRQFSTPGGIPSHVSVPTPGSIHEGGELGYVLMHAFGAAFDNPDLLVVAVVGDGEAETGPLEGSWKGISFLNPVRDGAVLPILHLNGYKIGNPTVLARSSDADVRQLLEGHGYEVHFVEGDDPVRVHQAFAATLDSCYDTHHGDPADARANGVTPPSPVARHRVAHAEGLDRARGGRWLAGGRDFRAHQVPLAGVKTNPAHLALLEQWMRSYHPETLFDATGRFVPELAALAPQRRPPHGRQPACQRRQADWSIWTCPIFETMPSRSRDRLPSTTNSTRQLGNSCAIIFTRNPRRPISGCSVPTRRTRIVWAMSLQWRTVASSARSSAYRRSRLARWTRDGGAQRT